MRERLSLMTKSMVLIASVPLAVIVALVIFDQIWFVPRLEQIRSSVRRANLEDRSPPPLIRRYVISAEGKSLYWQLARHIVYDTLPRSPQSTSDFNTRTLLSVLLLRMHLSEPEALGMYCSTVYVGNASHGLSVAAARLFHKPLSSLSSSEAATIVVLIKGPDY